MTIEASRPLAPAPSTPGGTGYGFGTAPVFLASISTILGAVLFLRFGYAVAHVGLSGALLIILLGHLVTVPTALAIAEIATNRRVEGGGEYFIISRSFGRSIGGAIGISLYLSQAISVAFYMIAFAEAFRPLAPWLEGMTGYVFDPRWISVPGTIALCALVVLRGADLGVKALWAVAAVLAVSLGLFLAGGPPADLAAASIRPFGTVERPDAFMLVFAIVFPAFTGMTAGVGLSGDLANPRRSLPLGILSATLGGMVVYVAIVIKLAFSASPELLAGDQLAMARIALVPLAIPVGLACATLSSAIGSILVAPRTLQAIGGDHILPSAPLSSFLERGVSATNEPRNATLITSALALATVSLGNVDFVARIISMFFMVTYGALCAIGFLEHLAARPSYRPSFRSKWYVSLIGALACLFLMFQMDPLFALLALGTMVILYRGMRAGQGGGDDLSEILRGALSQVTRAFQVRLQASAALRAGAEWRPTVLMVSQRTFERTAPFQLLEWICQRYGLGTYLHFESGLLDTAGHARSRESLRRLIDTTHARRSGILVECWVSPSLVSAAAQALQMPGVSGTETNTYLAEISGHDSDPDVDTQVAICRLAHAAAKSCVVLRHGDNFFGSRRALHIWITWHDHANASLMIVLAYILLGHADWRDADIQVFAAFPVSQVEQERARLLDQISSGRLPIASRNVEIIATTEGVDFDGLVAARSAAADLVIMGFDDARLEARGAALFRRHPALRDTLFVSASEQIAIG
jgi:amino acid transporter